MTHGTAGNIVDAIISDRSRPLSISRLSRIAMALSALVFTTSPIVAQPDDGGGVVAHGLGPPDEIRQLQGSALTAAANRGYEFERWRTPEEIAADQERLSAALNGLAPQQPGTVDAYVLSVALDSDLVFGREAREAANVLSHRYGADDRTVTLAAGIGDGEDTLPRGSISSLGTALGRIGAIMGEEDVLVLYTTSHGTPDGLYYHYGDKGYGFISPSRLSELLDEAGIENRMYIASACFAGIFVEGLSSDTSVIASAASSRRTSFGCNAANDWTYFGDAFINNALRQPVPFDRAFQRASMAISGWEKEDRLTPSQPQLSIGSDAARWLDAIEARTPQTATSPIGRPSRQAGR